LNLNGSGKIAELVGSKEIAMSLEERLAKEIREEEKCKRWVARVNGRMCVAMSGMMVIVGCFEAIRFPTSFVSWLLIIIGAIMFYIFRRWVQWGKQPLE
jgi:hypothetical protein